MNIVTKFLEPEDFTLLEPYFSAEGVPVPEPAYSRVLAAIDLDKGEIVGIVCLQLVAHVEPLIVHPEYRRRGIGRMLAEEIDGYITGVGLPGVYCQPVNEKSQAIARETGYEPVEHQLYLKIYDPSVRNMILGEISEETWQQLSQPPSGPEAP